MLFCYEVSSRSTIIAWLSLSEYVFSLAPSVSFGFLTLSYTSHPINLSGIPKDQVLVICKLGLVHYFMSAALPELLLNRGVETLELGGYF